MNHSASWQMSTDRGSTKLQWDTVESAGRDAIGWSLVADFARHRYESARTYIANELSAVNSRGIDVEVDGAVVGSVTCGQATDKPDVVDDHTFIAYVIENHPDALRVDSTWKDRFVKRLRKVGDDFIDTTTGEVVPGVAVVRTKPYWKVTKDADARERMNELLEHVQPSIAGFKALP